MLAVSLSQLPVSALLWQPRAGSWTFTFVCKATFRLEPIECPLAQEQEPLNEVDRPWSDEVKSLYAPSDLAPIKLRADVVLAGNAFAPAGSPKRSLIARLTVGDVNKAVELMCDRTMISDGTLREGAPFQKMPLIYERAAGGPATWNPVGMPMDRGDVYGNVALPNLQPPGTRLVKPTDIAPIGVGPIAPSWPERAERLGRHVSSWSHDDWNVGPLPDDVDAGYFNAAPRDQQLRELRDNEPIMLEHLHQEHSRLVTSLPGIHPRAFVDRRNGEAQPVAMRCDLLWIETVRAICTVTWRGQLALSHRDEAGRVLVALEKPGQRLTWSDVERLAPREPPPSVDLGPRVSLIRDEPTVNEGPRAFERESPVPKQPREPEMTGTITVGMLQELTGPTLPFASRAPSHPSDDRSAQTGGGLPFRSQAEERPTPGGGLPFRSPAPLPPPAPPPPRHEAQSFGALPKAVPPPVPTPPSAPIVPPAPIAVPAPIAPPMPIAPPIAAAPSFASAAAPGALPPPVLPPSLIASIDKRGGAAAASSAAAAASSPWASSRPENSAKPDTSAIVAPKPPPAPAAPIRPAVRLEPRDAIRLLFFDPACLPRARRTDRWRTLWKELAARPPDPDLDDPALANDPMELEDRKEMFELVSRADAVDAHGLNEAINDAVREDGKFVPPLLVVAGDLEMCFDELSTLKATMTTVAPLMGLDEALKATVEAAKEFLSLPNLLCSPGVADGLTSRIRDAFAQGKRVVPPGYLETETERALLEQRLYQKREVLGKVHVRGLLHLGSGSPAPLYLPADEAQKLPLMRRFKARAVVEAEHSLDGHETHAVALRALALARLIPPARR